MCCIVAVSLARPLNFLRQSSSGESLLVSQPGQPMRMMHSNSLVSTSSLLLPCSLFSRPRFTFPHQDRPPIVRPNNRPNNRPTDQPTDRLTNSTWQTGLMLVAILIPGVYTAWHGAVSGRRESEPDSPTPPAVQARLSHSLTNSLTNALTYSRTESLFIHFAHYSLTDSLTSVICF